ncbi:GGDEF domain-containing protein [Jatrophihabitans fulvus]
MSWTAAFVPRDVTLAKRLATVLTVVAAVVTMATALLGLAPSGGSWGVFAIVGPVLVLVGVAAIRTLPEPPAWLWALFPLGATATIAVADVATGDAGITAQIFFVFPVLYAGAQLRRPAAVAVTALAACSHLVVTFTALPAHVAAVDAVYVVGVLVVAAALLVHAGERAEQLVARLQEQAAIDPLTGLVTRRVLDSAATSALRSAGSDGGTALLLVDLDHFKAINDVHGHPAGDLVLREVSAVLHRVGRRTDVVSRMGGDEFAVLLAGCDLAAAEALAQEIVERVRALRIDVGGLTMAGEERATVLEVTASVGLAHLPTHARDVHALYRAADASLYRAKRAGRNRCADLQLDAA